MNSPEAHRQHPAPNPLLPASDSRVADLARDHPASIRVFQRHGIDFCCGGKMPLAEACQRRGLPLGAVLEELCATLGVAPVDPSEDGTVWGNRPVAELIGHILARYHAGLREELARLSAMAGRAAERHGAGHPELVEIRDLVLRLAAEMGTHLEREEREIFPALLRGGSGALAAVRSELETATAEHSLVGELLARLRAASGGFNPPEAACNTWRGLFHGLEELERDTHIHVHLENNVLFPRALESEAARS